jgi:hypothetical protein
MTKKFDEFLN